MDLFRKYLLTSAALFAPPGEGGEPEGEEHVEEAVSDEGEGEGLGEDTGAEEGQDDGEGDAEGDGEGSVDDQPAPRRRRGANETIRELRATAQTEKAERQRIERELSDIRAAQRAQEQRNQQESPTDRAARHVLMDPIDVIREEQRESEQRTAAMLQRQAMEFQETNDKLNYNSILRDSPNLKKFDAEVEKIRLEQQSAGRFVPREVLLDLAIGRAARAAAAKKGPQAQREGQRRVAAQQSRPAQGRSDAGTQRGRQGDSAEKRLENVPI